MKLMIDSLHLLRRGNQQGNKNVNNNNNNQPIQIGVTTTTTIE